MSTVYEEACFSQKYVYKGTKLFKERQKNVFDENRPRILTGMRTPTMIKSVNDAIRSDRRVKVEAITHNLNISVGIAH